MYTIYKGNYDHQLWLSYTIYHLLIGVDIGSEKCSKGSLKRLINPDTHGEKMMILRPLQNDLSYVASAVVYLFVLEHLK
jgi:hypothetical protein